MSPDESPNKPKARSFRRISLEAVAWVVGAAASLALAAGVYGAAGKTFVTTINDRLALPKELAVTSQDANIFLPPELSGQAPPPVIPGSASAAVPVGQAPVPPGSSFRPVQAPGLPAPAPGTVPPAPTVPGQPAPSFAPAPGPAPAPSAAPRPAPAPPPSPAPATQPRPAPTEAPTTVAPAPPTTSAPAPELPIIGDIGDAVGISRSGGRP